MKKRALIIGAGEAGKMVSNDMLRQSKIRDEYEIIGFIDDDPTKKPLLTWRAHANTLYTNWLNYYVYQVTPYKIDEINQ